MLSKPLAYGLALAAGLALTSAARAGDDVIRLTAPKPSGDVRNLGATADDLAAENVEAYYRGGYGYRGGFYGGYRGFYGGYRGYYGGYRAAYYHRPYYGGYYGYRPYYSSFYYRPYYSGYGGYGYGGYGYGYGGYGGYGGYPSYYGGGYYCISDVGGAGVYPVCSPRSVVVVRQPTTYGVQPLQPGLQTQPRDPAPIPQMPRADDGTFPYDGGPKVPVPMPEASEDARPALVPRVRPQADETVVSLKPRLVEEKKSGKWNFPAYGEQPTRSK
jgi:hypothetical protein